MPRHILAGLFVLVSPALALVSDPPAPRTDAYGDPLPPGVTMRIGTVRWRHNGIPHSIQFSPDGKSILSCESMSGRAYLWDSATGELVRTFGSDPVASSAAISPDGKTIAQGGVNKITLWDISTAKVLRTIPTNQRYLRDAHFSPDGRMIGANTQDHKCCVWDIGSNQVMLATPPDNGWSQGLAFSPDGELVACAYARGLVYLWNLRTGALVGTFRIGDTPVQEVHGLAFTADGRNLVAAGNRRASEQATSVSPVIRMWELASGKLRLDIDPGLQPGSDTLLSIARSSDSYTLAALTQNQKIGLWDLRSGQQIRELSLRSRSSYASRVAFSPDGRTLATVNGNVLYLWDAATGKQLNAYPDSPEGQFWKIVFTKDGRRLAALGTDLAVRLWDAQTGKHDKLLDRYETLGYGLAITTHGTKLVSATLDGWVRCYDLAKYQELWKERLAGMRPTGIAFSPDGRLIACAGGSGVRPAEAADCIQLWDAATGNQVRRIPANLGGLGGWLEFAADGDSVYVHAWGGGGLSRFEVATGKKLHQFAEAPGALYTHLVPEHGMLVTGTTDGMAVFMDLDKGTEVRKVEVSPGHPCSVALSPDGKYLATGPNDLRGRGDAKGRKLAVREVASEKVVCTIDLPDDIRISHLQFTPDGKQLVTGTLNCTILFWDWSKKP